MIALKYRIKVSIDPVHSWGDRTIDEIFIPSISCCINEEGCAFSSIEPRCLNKEMKEVQISKKDINNIKQFIDLKEKFEKICKKTFDKIERK